MHSHLFEHILNNDIIIHHAMKFFKYIIIILVLYAPTSVISQTNPDMFLKQSVEEVSLFISKNKEQLERDDKFLEEKMNELVIPRFDIVLMSKITLGKSTWTSISENQKNRFIESFKSLMVRTYMKSLTVFDGEKIKFLPYVTGKRLDVAKVKSIYVMSDGDLPVNYRLKKNDNGDWKVFDIIIDGISLLKNYRTDFQNHVKNNGIESLIKKLNED